MLDNRSAASYAASVDDAAAAEHARTLLLALDDADDLRRTISRRGGVRPSLQSLSVSAVALPAVADVSVDSVDADLNAAAASSPSHVDAACPDCDLSAVGVVASSSLAVAAGVHAAPRRSLRQLRRMPEPKNAARMWGVSDSDSTPLRGLGRAAPDSTATLLETSPFGGTPSAALTRDGPLQPASPAVATETPPRPSSTAACRRGMEPCHSEEEVDEATLLARARKAARAMIRKQEKRRKRLT